MAKVIHVHLLRPIDGTKQRDWYFSSITAVYSVLTAEQVGASRSYLLHAGLSGNGTIFTKCAIIKQSTLISARREGCISCDDWGDYRGLKLGIYKAFFDGFRIVLECRVNGVCRRPSASFFYVFLVLKIAQNSRICANEIGEKWKGRAKGRAKSWERMGRLTTIHTESACVWIVKTNWVEWTKRQHLKQLSFLWVPWNRG